jgi:hypothetical protein
LARVEIYRSLNLDLGQYDSTSYVGRDGSLGVAGLPGLVIPVSTIFDQARMSPLPYVNHAVIGALNTWPFVGTTRFPRLLE